MTASNPELDAQTAARTSGVRPQRRRISVWGVVTRTLGNLRRAARDAVIAVLAARTSRDWLVLRLDRGVVEEPPVSRWYASLISTPLALPVLLEALEYLEQDAKARGVVIRMGTAPIGWAKLQAISRACERLLQAGKHVVVYATHGGNAAAWLGSLTPHFWMAPPGRLDLIGVRAESPFVRSALERFHVRPLVLQAGRYKSVGEMLERDSMSDDSRAALDAVVEDLYTELVAALCRRAGSEEEARRWIDDGPYLATQALELGLVDRLLYPDELKDALGELGDGVAVASEPAGRSAGAEAAALAEPGDPDPDPACDAGPGRGGTLQHGAEPAREAEPERDREDEDVEDEDEEADGPSLVPLNTYLRLLTPRFRFKPLTRSQPSIVVLPVIGAIDAELARRLQVWLEDLRDDDDCRACVLRIDSPGGDPAASDLIWRAVTRFRERKPIVASMGDTAASGGYYAAMATQWIQAEATTLTGSIGVVMAGVELAPALEELGIRFDGVQRGRHAGIFSLAHEHSDEERELLEQQIALLYADFVAKAADGRQLSTEALDAVAQGRVWSGAAALEHRLIDALGGLAEAVARARELAGLEPREGELVWLQASTSPWRRLLGSSDELDETYSPAAESRAGARFWCPVRVELR